MANPTISPLSSAASDRDRILSNVALGALIVCPLIIALPPRKFDVYTTGLLAATLAGANQVTYDYTGRSLLQRQQAWMGAISPGDLPPAARETQRRLAEEKAARLAAQKGMAMRPAPGSEVHTSVLAELERAKGESVEEERKRGILEKVWMGGEGRDWKAKRDQREKEALEEGRGYGGLIVDQIWEVWTWGKKEVEEVKEEDEKVLAQRKKEERK